MGVKILSEATDTISWQKDGSSARFIELVCGDETGKVILSLRDLQAEGIAKNQVLCIRNAAVRMVKGHMRLVVDKWGKLDSDVNGTIDVIGDMNLSDIEFE